MSAAKPIKFLSWLICLILLSHLCVFEAEASFTKGTVFMQFAQTTNPFQPHQIFRPILSKLKAVTRVPLILPTFIPKENYPLYITINAATPDQYELTIGDVENCSGGNYCRYGTVSGRKIKASIPSVEQEYAFLNDPSYQPSERSPQKMERVVLANGIKAYFIPYVCGANCDDSKAIWEQNGYRYLVGLKRGEKKILMQVANSAIQNTR